MGHEKNDVSDNKIAPGRPVIIGGGGWRSDWKLIESSVKGRGKRDKENVYLQQSHDVQ